MILNGRLNAAVESDVVGYTTFTTEAGFKMLGCSFNGLDGNAASLNELITGEFSNADMVQIRLADGTYKPYIYMIARGGWVDPSNGYQLATTGIEPGTAFWLKTAKSTEVTITGSVVFGDYTYTGGAGFHMLTSVTPKDLSLNGDIEWTGLSNGDLLQIHNGSSYKPYVYMTARGGWVDPSNGYQLLSNDVKTIASGTSFWVQVKATSFTMTIAE